MGQASLAALGKRLRQWIGRRETADCTDDVLLRRFSAERDEAAFAALMRRHGPLVLGVCRRVLPDANDVDDAFQATFLVLAKKSGSITQGAALAGWLARVACRVAVTARTDAVRRRKLERQVGAMNPDRATEATWNDLRPMLDEEVDRLPGKYRLPVVLCYFEGKSHDEAAQELGWPKGTVAGRLARARELLHRRLTRRGIALSAGGLALLLTEQATPAAVPAQLMNASLQAAIEYTSHNLAAATHAVALADQMMQTMIWTKVKWTAGAMLAVGLVGVGAGAYFQTAAAQPVPIQRAPIQRAPLPAPAPGPGAANDLPVAPGAGDFFPAFNQAELLFTAKIANVQLGPVGLSEPPLHSVNFTFEDVKMLRGRKPTQLGFGYSVRSQQAPAFNVGDNVIVAAAGQRVNTVVPLSEPVLALAKQAVAVPIGWKLVNNKPVSPWAALGERAKLPGVKAAVVCSQSGRPALLAGDVELKVEKVIPAQVQKFKNPFGDGEFKITVTNPGKEAVEVPALLTDGKDILWADSILIVQGGKSHILPAAGAVRNNLQAVKIPAGGSVSGTINTLQLKDVSWPRGGSRVGFQFSLGELAANDFFYYFSDFHDKLRTAATTKVQ